MFFYFYLLIHGGYYEITSLCFSLHFLCHRDAQPIEKLKAAYKKFLARSMGRPKATDVGNAMSRSSFSFSLCLSNENLLQMSS